MVKYILEPMWEVIKWLFQVVCCAGIITIIIGSPIIPAMLAADYGNWWLLLYIPVAIIFGISLKQDK